MSITADTLTAQARLDTAVDTITAAQARDLTAAWALAWDEIAPALRGAVLDLLTTPGDRITLGQALRSRRLQAALELVAEKLTTLAKLSETRLTGDIAAVVATTGAAQASIVDSQLPPGYYDGLDTWDQIDPDAVDAIIRRVTQQIAALHVPLSAQAYDVVRRELVRGILVGDNPRRVAARMIARAEDGFNGGLTRALTIARTEILDAYRDAAALAQAQHADVLVGWTWLAHLSPRTCRSCLAMHGTVHDLTEPGPLDHQQGRCARVPTVKPWTELGIKDGEEPESVLPDAAAWFKGLTTTEQRAILGREGHAAWLAGEWPLTAWTRVRQTTGWRDSHVPARPPLGQASSRSTAA